MNIIFTEKDKKLEFSIIDYEFPLQKDMDNFDANWLTVKIDYSEGDSSASYTDNCILADELEAMTDGIENIVSGKETGIITDFMEPYLKFSLTKVGYIYAVQIRFVYDTTGSWKEIYISQGMDKNELCKMRDSFRTLCHSFPYRKV